MKDIDFDELDRAVSSALGNESQPAAAKLSIEPSAPAAPPAPEVAPVVTVTPSVQQGSASSPAVRRGGRFMDVVHPSSDMKTPSPSALRVPKRTFGPISDDLKAAPVIATTPVEQKAAPDESYPTLDTLSDESSPRMDTPTKEPEAPAPVHAWPDPLDVSPLETESKEEVISEPEPTTEPEAATSPVSIEEPTQTPFLTDTKVDKRPLGAFAEYEPGSEKMDTGATLVGASSLVSPELSADLVAVESKEMPNLEEQPAVKPEVTPPITVAASAQPASVAQQDNAEAKASNTDIHSVFDTSTYHQPLLPQKTHHKNRAWVWVLIIVGLLVVGAGLGALFFMAGF